MLGAVGRACQSMGLLVQRTSLPSVASTAHASGRWYPQPALDGRFISTCSHRQLPAPPPSSSTPSSINHLPSQSEEKKGIVLSRESAAPVYAPPRGQKTFGTVQGAKGQLLADYTTFEEAIGRAKLPWNDYSQMTSEERDIYMAHLTSIEEKKLSYKDPKTKLTVMNVSQLLLNGKCCGNGCRHCPYGMENASEETRKSKKWNGAYWV